MSVNKQLINDNKYFEIVDSLWNWNFFSDYL